MALVVLYLLTLAVSSTTSSFHDIYVDDRVRSLSEIEEIFDRALGFGRRVTKRSAITLNDLNTASQATEIELSPSCKLTLTPNQDLVSVQASDENCATKPSLKLMIDTLSEDLNVRSASSEFINPDAYLFNGATLNKGTKVLTLTATSKGAIRLNNPSFFVLTKVDLSVTMGTEDSSLSLKDLKIVMKGDIDIIGHTAKIDISKKSNEEKFSFSINIGEVKLKDYFQLCGIIIKEISYEGIPFNMGPFENVVLKSPEIRGIFLIESEEVNKAATLQVVAKANLQHSEAFTEATIYAIMDKHYASTPKGAIVSAIPSTYNIYTTLKRFLTYKGHINDLVILRKLRQQYLLKISQSNMISIDDPALTKLMAPYIEPNDVFEIDQGVSVDCIVPLKENLQNCSANLKISEIPEQVLLTVLIKSKGLQYKFPSKFQADMDSIMSCAAPETVPVRPSQILPDNSLVEIKDVIMSLGGHITIVCAINRNISLAGGKFQVSGMQLEVEHAKDEDDDQWKWKFSGTASVKLGDVDVKVTLEKKAEDYTVTAEMDSLMMTDVKKITGDNPLYNVMGIFPPLKNFGIKGAKIVWTFVGEKALTVIGNPILFGFDNLHCELMMYKQEETDAEVFGMVLREVKLPKLLEDICGKPLLHFNWLPDMTCYMIFSNVYDNETKFENTDLADLEEFDKGLSFNAKFTIPEDCKEDPLCKFMQEKIGKTASFSIGGRIEKKELGWLVEFTAAVEGSFTLIPNRLTLAKVELKIVIDGKDSLIELSCELHYQNPEANIKELKFYAMTNSSIILCVKKHLCLEVGQTIIKAGIKAAGIKYALRDAPCAISLSISGELELSFDMGGMWLQPFKVKPIGIGNCHLGISYQIGAPMPGFEIGGEVWIGIIDMGEGANNDHCIKVKCYFGFSPSEPTDNYIYASVNHLTAEAIFKAFKKKVTMPQALAQSGFPDGITVSFTSNEDGKQIENLDIDIPFGFYLKGTINILGFTVKCEIQISDDIIKIDVELSPLKLGGGLITIQRSDTDDTKGPKCFVLISDDSVQVHIEGYMSLLGMSKYVLIKVTDQGIIFNMTSDMFGILRTELFVQASYGSLQDASFKFIGKLHFSLKKISEEIKKFLDMIAKKASAAIDRAKATLERAKAKLEDAKAKVQGWKDNLRRFRERNNKKIEELERKKAAMQEDCKKNCGEVCIPFLDWNPHCFKIFWSWCGCPSWNKCRWKAPNLICIAGCEVKKFFNKVGATLQQVGLKIANAFSRVADFMLDIGTGILDIGKKCLSLAQGILDGVNAVVQVGVQIGKAMVTAVLEKMLEIRKLEVFGSFDSSLTACMGLDCDVTLLGMDIAFKGSICINLNFYKKLSSTLSAKKYPGCDEMEDKLEMEENKYGDLKSKEENLDSEVDKGQKEMDEQVEKPQRRSEIPEVLAQKAKEYNPFPEYVMKRSDIMSIFSTQAPWILADQVNPSRLPTRPFETKVDQAQKRTLEHENSEDSCLRLRGTISRFEEIIDGLHSTHNGIKEQRKMADAYDNAFTKGIEDVKRDIQHIAPDVRNDTLANKRTRTGEKHYNISNEEREDVYFWYFSLKDGHDSWRMKAHNIMQNQRKFAIPNFKDQVDYVYKKARGRDFSDFLDDLHVRAVDAYKRSNLPSNQSNGDTLLKNIKRTLNEVVKSKGKDPGWMHMKVREMKGDVRGIKDQLRHCRHEA